MLENPRILALSEIDNLLSEAVYAQRAGKESLAQKYVYYAVLLQKCSKCRPEALEPLFQRLATRGETAKDLFADVTKAYNTIKSQPPALHPRGQGRQVIQEPKQSEVIPHQSMDPVNKLPTRPQPVPATARQEPQRAYHETELGPQDEANQRRRKYTIEGTAGDREALDAGEPAQYLEGRTKLRRLHETAETRGLFHAWQGTL